MAEPLLELLGMKEIEVRASEVRRLGGWDLSWFSLLERWDIEGGQLAARHWFERRCFWADGSAVAFLW